MTNFGTHKHGYRNQQFVVFNVEVHLLTLCFRVLYDIVW